MIIRDHYWTYNISYRLCKLILYINWCNPYSIIIIIPYIGFRQKLKKKILISCAPDMLVKFLIRLKTWINFSCWNLSLFDKGSRNFHIFFCSLKPCFLLSITFEVLKLVSSIKESDNFKLNILKVYQTDPYWVFSKFSHLFSADANCQIYWDVSVIIVLVFVFSTTNKIFLKMKSTI